MQVVEVQRREGQGKLLGGTDPCVLKTEEEEEPWTVVESAPRWRKEQVQRMRKDRTQHVWLH